MFTATFKTPSHLFAKNFLISFISLFLMAAGSIPCQLFAQTGCEPEELAKLIANDRAADDRFGFSVSLDSNRAAIGAFYDDDNGMNSGSVYIFEESGGTWTQVDKLIASDGQADDQFGFSVALDGNRLLVGANGDVNNGLVTGSAYLFTFTSTNSWQETGKLLAYDGAASDNFGASVALEGNLALVGASGDSSFAGAVYAFTLGTTQSVKISADDLQSFANFGGSISLDGNRLAVGALADNNVNGNAAGAAYVFELIAGTWMQDIKLIASGAGEPNAFGYSVSLDNNRLLIGAADFQGGAAYVFEDSAGTWQEKKKLFLSNTTSNELYGEAVALDGDLAIVGAGSRFVNSIISGAVYAYTYDGSDWILVDELVANDPAVGDNFGSALALDGSISLIGARGKGPSNPFGEGAAYIFSVQGDQEVPMFDGGPGSPLTANTDAGKCDAVVSWMAPTATDNCDTDVSPVASANPGDTFPVGTTTVTYTATDSSGNTANLSFDIVVTDAEDPVFIDCPENIVVAASGDTMITWTIPMATDNCAVSGFLQTAGPISGSTFSFGTETITYEAMDEAGNSIECSFEVQVDPLTSIESLPDHLFSIHPNPFQEVLEIDWTGFAEPVEEIRLISIDGKILTRRSLPSSSGERLILSTADLPAGLFLLEVRSNKGRLFKRVAKQ